MDVDIVGGDVTGAQYVHAMILVTIHLLWQSPETLIAGEYMQSVDFQDTLVISAKEINQCDCSDKRTLCLEQACTMAIHV